jgi:hypothetical protein
MDSFYKAIYAKISGSDFATAIGNRFSYGEAKGAYPYATYFGLPSTNEDTFAETIDGMSLQINIYSDKSSSIEAMQILGKCRAVFDGKIITSTGNRPAKLHREMESPPWKNGDVWVGSIEFITLLMKE